jgi:predicted permease
MTQWMNSGDRKRHLSDLESEIQNHIEIETQDNIARGMSPEEARYAAMRKFGNVTRVIEDTREVWAIAWLDHLIQDLRFALRGIRKSPLFATVVVLTLALGIGANTTVFTFVENIVMRSLPVIDPEQVVSLNWGNEANMSYPNYVDFRDRNTVFSGLIACDFNVVSMSIQPRDNFRVWGYDVSGNYFETLGISPELGRFFGPVEDVKPGANAVVVISDRYWRTRLAADPNVVGRVLKINGYPFTVIGVAPPSFFGTELIVAGDFWVPMSMELQISPRHDWLHDRSSQTVWTLGRLKRGVSHTQAEADRNLIARQLAETYPKDVNPKANFLLSRPGLVGNGLRGPVTGFGAALSAIAGMALFLACVNLAGMLLARSSDRHREIGIRLAIGASRFQLLRQLMTESLVLALIGGSLGLAVAYGTCHLLSLWHPNFDIPIRTMLQPDGTVLVFTLTSSVLTVLLFGLAPALHSVRIDLIPSLKDEPTLIRYRRVSIRDVLVGAQIALSVILVISSVLVVRSLQHALTLNLGFNPNDAVSVSFDLRLQGYDEERSRRFVAAILQKSSALPGLKSVGIINNLPLRAEGSNGIMSRVDRPIPPRSEWRSAIIYNISPGYLETAGTRLLSGRDVNDYDRRGMQEVAIVNEALARLLFENESPLGRRVRLGDHALEIIGVVETGKYQFLSEDPHPAVFLPIAQTGPGSKLTTLVARTRMPAYQATELLRHAVLDLDSELTLFNTGSLKDQLSLPLFPARAAAIVLGVFGVLAMVLASTGLLALVAYSVARRMREIGIRMALGARPAQVLSSVLGRTLILSGTGVLIGILITVASGRFLTAILYGISPYDPVAYVIAIWMIGAVAVIACWTPASRAIHVDPARTLREN